MSRYSWLLVAVVTVSLVAAAHAEVRVDQLDFGGWSGCLRVTNGTVEAVVTTAVGPRIIRFGFVGGPNEFWENPAEAGKAGGDEWRIYGGARLWHAPETKPRTYLPDNSPIQWERIPRGVRLIQPVEEGSGIGKEIELTLAEEGASARVLYRLTNAGQWPVELAPWAIAAMAPGGIGVFPMPTSPADPFGFAPNRWLALWTYTDMSDARLTLGKRFILLRQSDTATEALKIGLNGQDGWIAYARDGRCFVKTYQYVPGATYPDGGCSIESYTNSNPNMLELETLAPLAPLAPGASSEHVEHWRLFDKVPAGETEAWAERTIAPLGREAVGG